MNKRAKIAIAGTTTAAALWLGAGLAGAVSLPLLPSPAQPSVADEKLAELSVPPGDQDANRQDDEARAAHQPADPGAQAGEQEQDEATAEGQDNRPTDTHGYEVSQLATSTDAVGRDKGAAVSTLAKTWGAEQRDDHAADAAGEQHGQAGQHGSPHED